MSQAGTGPGWYPDPSGRHEYRYFDGTAWTPVVSDGGVQSQEGGTGTGTGAAAAGAAAGMGVAGASTPQGWYGASDPQATPAGQYGQPQQWTGAPGGDGQMAPVAPGHKSRKWVIPVIAGVVVLALVAGLVGWRVWSNRAPGQPGDVSAAAKSGDTIEVTWTAPGGTDVEQYLVSRNGEQIGTVPGGTLNYKDNSDLNPADFYTYTVVAQAHGKDSAAGTSAEVRTDAPQPGSVSVEQGTGSVTLTWEAPKGATKPDSYLIYRDGEQVKSVSGSKTSFRDSGLAPDTAYKYAVASLWGARESERSAVKARTGRPSVAAARLTGDYSVTVKMAANGGGDWPKKGKSWDESWSFKPKCDSGACDVVVNADVVPEGYTPSPFKITLTRSGDTYSGSTVTNITSCRKVNVKNTVIMKLTVKKAGVAGTEWVAQAFTGSVQIKSPYTDADGNYYCPAQTVSTVVAGKVTGF